MILFRILFFIRLVESLPLSSMTIGTNESLVEVWLPPPVHSCRKTFNADGLIPDVNCRRSAGLMCDSELYPAFFNRGLGSSVKGHCGRLRHIGEKCAGHSECSEKSSSGSLLPIIVPGWRVQCSNGICSQGKEEGEACRLELKSGNPSNGYGGFSCKVGTMCVHDEITAVREWMAGGRRAGKIVGGFCHRNYQQGESCSIRSEEGKWVPDPARCSVNPSHYSPPTTHPTPAPTRSPTFRGGYDSDLWGVSEGLGGIILSETSNGLQVDALANVPLCLHYSLSTFKTWTSVGPTSNPTPHPTPARPVQTYTGGYNSDLWGASQGLGGIILSETEDFIWDKHPRDPSVPQYYCERQHFLNEKCVNENDCVGPNDDGGLACFRDPGLKAKKHATETIATVDFGLCSPKRKKGETCSSSDSCVSSCLCYRERCYRKGENAKPGKQCSVRYDCDPTVEEPKGRKNFCFLKGGDPDNGKCSTPRKKDKSCNANQGPVECELEECRKGKCIGGSVTDKSVEDIVNWIATYSITDDTSYCYRPVAIPKTCGEGQKQIGLECYPDCQKGFTGVGFLCWKGILAYDRSPPWSKRFVWDCPDGYYADGGLCSHKCPITQTHGCVAGCAKTQHDCAYATVSMFTGPLEVLANVATFGITKAITASTKATILAVKMAKETATKIKNGIDTGSTMATVLGGVKTQIDYVMTNVGSLPDDKLFVEGVHNELRAVGCHKDNQTIPACWEKVRERWVKAKTMALLHAEGDNYDPGDLAPTTGYALNTLALADPTGIMGMVLNFVKPKCVYPGPLLPLVIIDEF